MGAFFLGGGLTIITLVKIHPWLAHPRAQTWAVEHWAESSMLNSPNSPERWVPFLTPIYR